MNIRQFKYVLSLAEFQNFDLAAEKCFVSQSTLSTMIIRLEKEIGITIFDRNKRPLKVTKEGEAIIERLKIITKEIDELNEVMNMIKGEIKGTLNLGCIPTVAPFLLPLFLVDFTKKYPDLKIEVSEMCTEQIVHRLKSRELDIGITSTPINDPELLEYNLYKEPFVLYNTEKKKLPEIAIEDINLDNFWLMEEGHCLRTQVADICSKSNASINTSTNVNFKASSVDSLIRFVEANRGKTLLPFLATKGFSQDKLEYIRPLKPPRPYRQIGLITYRYFPRKHIVNLLRDNIIDKTNLSL